MTASAHSRTRLPAFGRELANLRRRGLVPQAGSIRIAIDDWELRGSRADYGHVVVAADHDPAELDFSFLFGLDAWVIFRSNLTDTRRARAVIERISMFNPRRILWIDRDAPIPTVTFARKSPS